MRIAGPFKDLEPIVAENVPLSRHTWFKIGGPARWLIQPRSIEELQAAAARCAEYHIPVYILGLGANVLIRDEGIDGAVFRLSDEFWQKVEIEKDTVHARAGADIQKLVLQTARAGLSGLQCLAGIPGTIGGGIRMNCGGKFGDIGAVVTRVTVMDPDGNLFERTKDDLVFSYRHTNIAAPFILNATLQLEEDDPNRITHETREIWMYKRNSQPLNTKNAGCIFKNPPEGPSAGALIDQAGLKGMRTGGAEVSAKHANFIIAHEGTTAADILKLIRIVHDKVLEHHGIDLKTEVQVWPWDSEP